MRKEIKDFIENIHGMPNTLVTAVYHDIQENWCLAGAKALRLISKLLTAPLWRLLEDPNVHIAQMGPIFTQLVEFLEEDCEEGTLECVMTGTCAPEEFVPLIARDEVFESLIAQDATDATVEKILKFVFAEWAILLKRLVSDHLPEGKFHDMEANESLGVTQQETQSVTKHNKLCEELFSHLDRLRMVRPHASTLANEAHILFRKNKCATWLDNKDCVEKNAILTSSRKRVHTLRGNFLHKLAEFSERRKENLQQKQERLSKLRQKQFEKKEDLTKNIMYYGLWQSPAEIDEKLSTIKTQKEKLEALKVQINFRKSVLEQPVSDKHLLQFSSKETGNFSVAQLTENVKALVEGAHLIVANRCNSAEGGTHMLVGKRVQHRFVDENEEIVWYGGDVISQVPGFPEWFNITYDDDPAVYSYQLLKDLESGDLKLEIPTTDEE